MRKLILITAIGMASIAAAPAATATANANDSTDTKAAQTATSATSSAPAPEEKKICKLLPSSYSHRSDRVCLTKAQWDKVDEETKD